MLNNNGGILRNTYRVDRFLWAGEYPGEWSSIYTSMSGERFTTPKNVMTERLRMLLSFGIRNFIDLTEPHEHGVKFSHSLGSRTSVELQPYQQFLRPEIGYQRFQIEDERVPGRAYMRTIMAALWGAHRNEIPTIVHCRGGLGRTGMVVGCWLIEQGLSPARALDQLFVLRQDCHTRHSPNTGEQIEFIRSWVGTFDHASDNVLPMLEARLQGHRIQVEFMPGDDSEVAYLQSPKKDDND